MRKAQATIRADLCQQKIAVISTHPQTLITLLKSYLWIYSDVLKVGLLDGFTACTRNFNIVLTMRFLY
jgi:hypothetical protein